MGCRYAFGAHLCTAGCIQCSSRVLDNGCPYIPCLSASLNSEDKFAEAKYWNRKSFQNIKMALALENELTLKVSSAIASYHSPEMPLSMVWMTVCPQFIYWNLITLLTALGDKALWRRRGQRDSDPVNKMRLWRPSPRLQDKLLSKNQK